MNPDTPSLTERAPSLDRDGRAAYRVPSTDWSVSTAVVEAVAEVADRDPLAENFVLYDAIDPDALTVSSRTTETKRPERRVASSSIFRDVVSRSTPTVTSSSSNPATVRTCAGRAHSRCDVARPE
nr:HalOD1 output domain-containing protein [Halorussus aquaticus]